MKITKLCKPITGNYLKEGLRLAILNGGILLAGGGISLGLLYLTGIVRRAGIPLPFPVWLIMIGIGVPCFIIWFEYGKSFGYLIRERFIIRGATIAMLGNLPGTGCLYILIKMSFDYVGQEIYKIILILLSMFIIVMPIMTVLGVLDAKKAVAKK